MFPGLLKRFWTFEPETLTLRYTRSAKHTVKQARLVTLVTENAEDIAPCGILAVPLVVERFDIEPFSDFSAK